MSAGRKHAVPPSPGIFRATSPPFAIRRRDTATVKPSAASRRTRPSPMPPVEPVTTATLWSLAIFVAPSLRKYPDYHGFLKQADRQRLLVLRDDGRAIVNRVGSR